LALQLCSQNIIWLREGKIKPLEIHGWKNKKTTGQVAFLYHPVTCDKHPTQRFVSE
jgi:hypothetical protein